MSSSICWMDLCCSGLRISLIDITDLTDSIDPSRDGLLDEGNGPPSPSVRIDMSDNVDTL